MAKSITPRKRGPKPETFAFSSGSGTGNVGKGLKKPSPKGGWPKPPNKKGRGGR